MTARATKEDKAGPAGREDVDAYIAAFPADVQVHLNKVRGTIKHVLPDAAEVIRYRIPTFVMGENVVHFAGFKNHIGFYPGPSGIAAFQDELSAFKGAKGSVQFPLDRPMPLRLIAKIVRFRRQEIEAKATTGPRKGRRRPAKPVAGQQPKTIKAYIAAAPAEGQKVLRDLYTVLKSVAPKAKEAIKWGNPVFEERRILFAFSAHKAHANFMPTRSALAPFRKELQDHATGKDTLRLPYDRPIPKTLIRRIATYRAKDVRENDARWM